MIELVFTDSYKKRAQVFFKRHPECIKQYGKCLELLAINPRHPSLRLHKLKGRLQALHSVSLNIAYRILIEFVMEKGRIIFISIGSRDEVY
jgi:mRNA-degrading endonuclease YafQ of YafQ-DinJ toxin-antitoxin module